ncbi:hypothetical protein ES332_D07G136800v1 [Gossypium tomentosum]|uniref:Uncharacterized protein n=1 Tax=Gossypium tomentosum TaxID=34277 RepID=A0A5D2K717_GOSTO|nr:hypothetical protein ES332_D07G136800v1 [Gossypium tomentosum]
MRGLSVFDCFIHLPGGFHWFHRSSTVSLFFIPLKSFRSSTVSFIFLEVHYCFDCSFILLVSVKYSISSLLVSVK